VTSAEVSVVIPLFNKEKYIERTIASALGQTLTDIEIIVIDDGSTDGGPDKVRQIDDPRVRMVSQLNQGVSVARNRGIAEARSKLIALLDADDQWRPEYLAALTGLRKQYPEARVLASGIEVIRPGRPNYIPTYSLPERGVLDLSEYMRICIRIRPPLASSAVIAEKALFDEIGGFPEGQARAEDIDTWFRLIAESPCAFLNRPLVIYWANLPNSACLIPITTEMPSLEKELEEQIACGSHVAGDRNLLRDFLAWRKFGRIRRMVQLGEVNEARPHILSGMQSRQMRLKYLRLYVQSFFPMRGTQKHQLAR
jgi:glycosyltransferase involved in cell wall biosynthesis